MVYGSENPLLDHTFFPDRGAVTLEVPDFDEAAVAITAPPAPMKVMVIVPAARKARIEHGALFVEGHFKTRELLEGDEAVKRWRAFVAR